MFMKKITKLMSHLFIDKQIKKNSNKRQDKRFIVFKNKIFLAYCLHILLKRAYFAENDIFFTDTDNRAWTVGQNDVSVLRRPTAEVEQWRHGADAATTFGGGGGGHVAVVGRRLRAQAAVDAAADHGQEDVPTAHVRAPGRAVADPNSAARQPIAAARHPRFAQQ